jgi:hypothetical protein
MRAAIRAKLDAATSFTDGAGPQTTSTAATGPTTAYLTIPAIVAELGLEYSFVRECFAKLPGIIRIGNGDGRRKKILVPRAVFEAWITKNTVKEGGERITYKRHRRTLVERRAPKLATNNGGYAVQ